jgi:hypothetical protein
MYYMKGNLVSEMDNFTAARESFGALVQLVQQHEHSKSSEVARQVLCSCLRPEYFIRIWDLSRFDVTNRQHVLNVIEAVAVYPAKFERWALEHFGEELIAIRSEADPGVRGQATDFLKFKPFQAAPRS